MKVVLAVALAFISILCACQAASARELFYSGNIVADSIGINMDIGDEEAAISLIYLLVNRSTEMEEINLEYPAAPASVTTDGEALANPVVFYPGDRKAVTIDFKLDTKGDTSKSITLDPTLLFGGNPNSEPAGALTISASLPAGVTGLTWASQEPDEESIENGRYHYTWKDTDVYPTQLTVTWSTLGIDLSIEKSASPMEITQADQVIMVEITLTNNGSTGLNDIHLVDQYISSHFGEIEPASESGALENLVFWEKGITSLGPGETMALAYSVTYIGPPSEVREFDMNPTVVTVGGNLVSVSNKVRMKVETPTPTSAPTAETQAVAEPVTSPAPGADTEEAESGNASLPLVFYIGIPVVVVVIILVGYLLFRRKPAK